MDKILTKPQLRQKAFSILQKELDVSQFIEFLQDMGMQSGDFTEEKYLQSQPLVDEILNNLKKNKY